MKRADKERHEMVASALRDIGIRDFLIFGLRKTETCKDDEVETFYCLSAGDRADLVGALTNVFLNSPDIGELLIGILHEVYHGEKKRLEGLRRGFGAGAGPIARA